MKEKIFIVWSGTSLHAQQVKNLLTQLGYGTIIGGNINTAPNSMFIGATIIEQMSQCSQAIILFERKNDCNVISGNALFEFGYLLATLGIKKNYVFFIDIKPEEKSYVIPSDLENVWAEYLSSSNELAQNIVDVFMDRQKQPITINKADIITKWYRYKHIIETYPSNPVCSNYELAQYLIFYIQAIYFYKDYETERFINQLFLNEHEYSEELRCSLYAIRTTLNFYSVFRSKSNAKIDIDKFDRLVDEYEDLVDRIDSLEDSEFKHWIIAIVEENIGFLYHYYLLFSDILPDKKCLLYNQMLVHTQRAISFLQTIENSTNNLYNDAYFIYLFLSYLFRQEAIAYEFIGTHQNKSDHFVKRQQRYKDAFNMRKKLFLQYMNPLANSMVANSIELEYHMSMAEVLEFIDSPTKKENYVNKLRNYVKRVETSDLTFYEGINIIKKYI